MPSFKVEKTVSINAQPEKIFKILNDYSHWPNWSPWLILEPGVKIILGEGSKEYSWEGKRTGSGQMKIIKEDAPLQLDMEVIFLKPWKSKAPVRFILKPDGSSTQVTWLMTGSLPFFMFWMKKMMSAYIGMDYSRGLLMLKDYVETGSVPSKLEFLGIQLYSGCSYVGIRSACTIETVGPRMEEDFSRLNQWAEGHHELLDGQAFSIYHKWDVVKDKVEYTSAISVKEPLAEIPEGFMAGSIPATQVNTIAHSGPYRHLGNAWSAQYTMQRSKEFKYRKGIDPFETYKSMPGVVPEKEILTDVHFPVS